MDTTTNAAPVEDVRKISRQLIDEFAEAPQGEIKNASAAGTNMIRRKIRENGFLRRILPPENKTNEDLDRVVDHDRPLIIEEMEPSSKGAKSMPFGDSAESQSFYGNKFQVVFNQITTPEFTKDINELRTYRGDVRQVVTDNALKDVQTEEDGQFIAGVDTTCGSSSGVGLAGVQQSFLIPGGITRDNYVDALSKLEDLDLNNGVFLMNRKTAKQFLKWTRDEIGGDLAQDLFKEGLSALQEATIMGVKHIFTIKRNLVADNIVYMFGEPNFLGKFYILQDLCMFVEKKKDILRFSARETIGTSIANVNAVAKCNFA